MTNHRIFGATTALLAASLGLVAGVAAADPPPAPVAQTFVDRAGLDDPVHLNEDSLKFQTKGPTDVRFQKVTYGVGAASGWHTHPGLVIVAVAQGTITAFEGDCSTTTHGPGESFLEYGDQTGQLVNNSGSDVVLYATFVVPDGSPFRENTVPPPVCAS